MNNIQRIKEILEGNPAISTKELVEKLCTINKVAYDSHFVIDIDYLIEHTPILKALRKKSPKLVGYAVNLGTVKDGGDIEYVRYTTVDTLKSAEKVLGVLTMDHETKYWDEVQVEEIYEYENGDFDYKEIRRDWPNKGMLNKAYWDCVARMNSKVVHGIDIAADYEDFEPQNICWLQLGYFSPLSDCGYFYYSSIEEFNDAIKHIKHLSDSDVTTTQIKEYLDWATDNECLFSKKESQISQIVEMLYHR